MPRGDLHHAQSPMTLLTRRSLLLHRSEHASHVYDAGHVLLRDIAVGHCRRSEHAGHIIDAGHIPLRDTDVKHCLLSEHANLIGQARHVPLRNIGAKYRRRSEHARQNYPRHAPLRDKHYRR